MQEAALPLWVGTGFHFAMEDWHGIQDHGDSPIHGWEAFTAACREAHRDRDCRFQLPGDWESGDELAREMLDYYVEWLDNRDVLETFQLEDGTYMVEVDFEIKLEDLVEGDELKEFFHNVIYRGTIDRVVINEEGRLRLIDYKTAARFEHHHLEVDDQVSSYMWASSLLWPEYEIVDFIYQQHRKVTVEPPRVLASGKISSAKQQSTSANRYQKALEDLYGRVSAAPQSNRACLSELESQETENRDPYIRRDITARTAEQLASKQLQILVEVAEMLDPDLPIYPNPSNACSWCNMQDICLAQDDGSDWKAMLEEVTVPAQEELHPWRQYLS